VPQPFPARRVKDYIVSGGRFAQDTIHPTGFAFMRSFRFFPLAAFLLLLLPALPAQAQQPAAKPLPDIHQLMKEVHEHQKQLDKVRENYTYTSSQTTEDIDAKGHVTKTETREVEIFFVNGHEIFRRVKKDGKPLDDSEQQKETERVTKAVEKAQQPETKKQEEQQITVSHILELMDVRNPRRELYRGRPTIVFDFVGRKDAKTHGIVEDASKKIQGTMWVDEADREVAHMDVTFNDNFHVAGGLVANIEKGSSIHFDQAPVNGEIWFPTGGESTLAVRLFLVKGIRQHETMRDYGFQRFHVEAEQGKESRVVLEKKP
jgi:SepF-like predicted cell division protein (DUF552 family)